MFDRARNFIKDESGYTIQALVWDIVAGLGSAAVAFALLGAGRFQGGAGSDDLKAVMTPSALPNAQEQITNLKAGYTGAITGMEVGTAAAGN